MARKAKPLPPSDWVIRSAQPGGIERIEAWFGSHGYDPHRHDTYSIGRTLAGVQSFHYKGFAAQRPTGQHAGVAPGRTA